MARRRLDAVLNLNLPSTLKARLTRLARAANRNRSAVARVALRRGLAELERELTAGTLGKNRS